MTHPQGKIDNMDEVKRKTIKITGFHEDIDKITKAAKAAHTTASMLVLDLCMSQLDRIFKVRYLGEEKSGLIPGKIYSCLEYSKEKNHENYMRVIDESGEAYIYCPDDFEVIKNKGKKDD